MQKKEIKVVYDNQMKVVKGIVSKEFKRKASVFGTEEFYKLRDFIKNNEGVEIKVGAITSNANKKTRKFMSISNMREYVSNKDNTLSEEFERQVYLSKQKGKGAYHYVVKWFENKFTDEEDYLAFFGKLAEASRAEEPASAC